MIVNLNGMHDV